MSPDCQVFIGAFRNLSPHFTLIYVGGSPDCLFKYNDLNLIFA